jgi:hypothetical protein
MGDALLHDDAEREADYMSDAETALEVAGLKGGRW